MADPARAPAEILSLPQGGGAMHGIGETFAPDVQTGTGNLTIPLTVPSGRNGFDPELALTYSTGNGNGRFGLGWRSRCPGRLRPARHVRRRRGARQRSTSVTKWA